MRDEFDELLRFWFDRGVGGFRIDVAHGLIKDRELRDGVRFMRERPEVHEIYRRWQEIAEEYIPKPTLMGETYVSLGKLFAYVAHLDLAQNFPFLRASFDVDELRPIVETTMRKLPAGREPVWFGSNHDHSRMATQVGGRRRAQAQGGALPAAHPARQRDPLSGRRARSRGRRRSCRSHRSISPFRPVTPRARRSPGRAAARNGRAPGSRCRTPRATPRTATILPYARRADRAAQGARRRLPQRSRAPTASGPMREATGRACST